jgi:hypothetical protein
MFVLWQSAVVVVRGGRRKGLAVLDLSPAGPSQQRPSSLLKNPFRAIGEA